MSEETAHTLVRTAAALLDPATLEVVWHNQLALELLPESARTEGFLGRRLPDVDPVFTALGLEQSFLRVGETGETFNYSAHLPSPADGHVLKMSLYRTSAHLLLLLIDANL